MENFSDNILVLDEQENQDVKTVQPTVEPLSVGVLDGTEEIKPIEALSTVGESTEIQPLVSNEALPIDEFTPIDETTDSTAVEERAQTQPLTTAEAEQIEVTTDASSSGITGALSEIEVPEPPHVPEIGTVGYRDGKPSPIVPDDFEGQTKLVTIIRKKSLAGVFATFKVYIDGVCVCDLKNGHQQSFRLNFDAHELKILPAPDEFTDPVIIPIGAKPRTYVVSISGAIDGNAEVKVEEEQPE